MPLRKKKTNNDKLGSAVGGCMERRKPPQNRERSGRMKLPVTSNPVLDPLSARFGVEVREAHVGLRPEDHDHDIGVSHNEVQTTENPMPYVLEDGNQNLHGSQDPHIVLEDNCGRGDSGYGVEEMLDSGVCADAGGGVSAAHGQATVADVDGVGRHSRMQEEESDDAGNLDTLQQLHLLLRNLTPAQRALFNSTSSSHEELNITDTQRTSHQRKVESRSISENVGSKGAGRQVKHARLKQNSPVEPFDRGYSEVRVDAALHPISVQGGKPKSSVDELCEMIAEAQKQTFQQIRGMSTSANQEPGTPRGDGASGSKSKGKRKRHVDHERHCTSMTSGGSSQRSLSIRSADPGGTGVALSTGDLLDFQFGSDWPVVKDIPPVHVDKYGYPAGEYWAHMKPYCYDRGQHHFPWHIEWRKQSNVLKAKFILKLRTKYPGNWESKGVLRSLGKSIREKRARVKARFRCYDNPKDVPCPIACSPESFWQIYRDSKDPVKMAKSKLCVARAQERKATGRVTFSHKCGRHGYDGVHKVFVSFFTSIDFTFRLSSFMTLFFFS